MKRFIPIIVILPILAACNKPWDDKGKEKLPGERIPVLPHTSMLPSPSTAAIKLHLAGSTKTSSWHSVEIGAQAANPELSLNISKRFVIKLHAAVGDFGFLTTPVVADNAIFALDTNGEIKAFDWGTGKEKWRNTELSPESHLSVFDTKYYAGGLLFYNNVLFVTSGTSDVIAVDTATGKTKWKRRITGITRAVPVGYGNDILIQTLEGSIYSLSMNDGSITWLRMGNAESISVISADYPLVYGQKLFVQTGGQGMVIYNLKTRQEVSMLSLSELKIAEQLDGAEEVAYIPAKSGAYIYAYGRSSLAAIDANSNEPLWRKQMYVVAPLAVSGNALFALINDSGIHHLIAIERHSGNVVWRRNISTELLNGKQINISAPFIAGGKVGLTTDNGMLYWFDPASGQNAGNTNIEPGVYASNPVLVAGSLLLSSSKGTITRYDSGN